MSSLSIEFLFGQLSRPLLTGGIAIVFTLLTFIRCASHTDSKLQGCQLKLLKSCDVALNALDRFDKLDKYLSVLGKAVAENAKTVISLTL